MTRDAVEASSSRTLGREQERTRALEEEVLLGLGLPFGHEDILGRTRTQGGKEKETVVHPQTSIPRQTLPPNTLYPLHMPPSPPATPATPSMPSTFLPTPYGPFSHEGRLSSFSLPSEEPKANTSTSTFHKTPIRDPAAPFGRPKIVDNSPYATFTPKPIPSATSLPITPLRQRHRRNSSTNAAKLTNGKAALEVPRECLIAVGTIVLDGYLVRDGEVEVEVLDGWRVLGRDDLEKMDELEIELPPSPTSPHVVDEPSTPSTSSAILPPPLTPIRLGKKKRGRTYSIPSTPRSPKKLKSTNSVLDSILALQDANLLRSTFSRSPLDSCKIIVRTYLIPSDAEINYLRRRNPVGSTIRSVFNLIRTNRDEWEGKTIADDPKMFLEEEDERSLLEIYRAIDSPSQEAKWVDRLEGLSERVREELEVVLEESPEGMITDLYPYQKASLVKMLARERAPQWRLDPAFEERTSFLDPTKKVFVGVSGEVRLAVGKFKEPRGGILAENMGTGKTAICLGLVLSTLGEIPNVSDDPSTYLDDTPAPPPTVLTALSLHFPFPAYTSERANLRPRVPPPLVGYEPSNTEIQEYEAALAFQARLDAKEREPGVPSLGHLLVNKTRTSTILIPYDGDDSDLASGLLKELNENGPFYYIHPSAEMRDSREGRRKPYQSIPIIVARTTLIVVPTDLVKQWEDEIAKHVEPGRLRVVRMKTTRDVYLSSENLATYDVILMSTSRFSDAADDTTSPLKRVHWKRLIVDEGHVLAGDNRMRKLVQELRCESRWAISGTPTTNLRDATGPDEGALSSPDFLTGGNEKDFQRFGEIFSRFLHHPAFPRADTWRSLITMPFIEDRKGAGRLQRLLNDAMVRNSPEKIKESVKLPPFHSSVVYLKLRGAELLTYNALLATFSLNSILSQRVQEDYLFHASKRKWLDELTLNLAASSSFYTSKEIVANFNATIEYAEEELGDERKSGKWSSEDRQAAQYAVEQIKAALKDPEWQSIAFSLGPHLQIQGLRNDILKIFAGRSIAETSQHRSIVPVSELVSFRKNLKEVRRASTASWRDDEELLEEFHTLKVKQLQAATEKDVKPPKRKLGHNDDLVAVPSNSIFRSLTIGSTTSTKINYVVNELRSHPNDKFIVFSCTLSDLIFAVLSETLDVMGISHSIYAGHGTKDRGATAAHFNATTVRQCRVILVDAKLGGRGLNLTGASRIIMLEPVWVPDLEIQAAKRAHRLGQTKPVDLKILVVEGSYEHALLERRGKLSLDDFNKTKKPQGDSHLRTILQSAAYLKPPPPENAVDMRPLLSVEELGAIDDEQPGALRPVAGPSTGVRKQRGSDKSKGKGKEVAREEVVEEEDHSLKRVRFLEQI